MNRKYLILTMFCLAFLPRVSAQDVETTYLSYTTPQTFEIAGITVMGSTSLDPRSIMLLAGLEFGDKITIPGEKISSAIDRLWRHGSFGNVEIYAAAIEENKIFLVVELEELPRINQLEVTGLRKFQANKLQEELELNIGDALTENRLSRARTKGINFYREKGFLNANITTIQKFDTATGNINLTLDVDRGDRVKIQTIEIIGNEAPRIDNPNESFRAFRQLSRIVVGASDQAFSDAKVRRTMKSTKQQNVFRFWKRSKYVEPDFREDLKTLAAAYSRKGFRDMRVVHDSLTVINNRRVKLTIELTEGNTYYFGDISFVGNTRYPDEFLAHVLDIKRGEVFDDEKLQKNLMFNPQQGDVHSMYSDEGYLWFSVNPVETRVVNDTVDLEIRIREGRQARFSRVEVAGNTRTNDYVITRELRTLPGQMFSRRDVINSMNELRMMNYFNNETINPDIRPNADENTADITFHVEEVGSDQVELSGGWGGGMIVGTLGFSFNNFSIQNLFRKERWRPLPSGDGQRFTIRAQSNGSAYYAVSTSYTEPWFGGKRPYAFSVSAYSSMQSNGLRRGNDMRGEVVTTGGSLGLGMRLRVPDPFFTLYQGISYQRYNISNFYKVFPVEDGQYNQFSYTISLSRTSLNAAIFPTEGADFSVSFQTTPPWLTNNIEITDEMTPQERDQAMFKWLEFYKWNFKAGWFLNPVAKLVVCPRVRFGVIGRYNSDVGYTPFERFKLGGDGMAMHSYSGAEIIGMRGYTNESLSPETGAMAFNKLTLELRYPIVTNPAATIYGLAFVEAGNSWENPRRINPFQNYRSAGAGLRLFLSAMGMFGLDWGYGFDGPMGNRSQFHFSINQSID